MGGVVKVIDSYIFENGRLFFGKDGEEGEEDKDDDTSSSLFFILCLKVLATAVIPETIVFTAEDVSE